MTLRTITFDDEQWRVVPREPTEDMLLRGYSALMAWDARTGDDYGIREVFLAMLAAAPEPPAQQPMTDAADPDAIVAPLPAPEVGEERQAMIDQLRDQAIELDMLREALGVPYEPHQSLLERMLEAARGRAGLGAAPKPPAQEPGTAAEIEALRAEMERLRSLLRACADFHERNFFGTKGIYDCLDKHGMFAQSSALALMMMERSLQAADQAVMSGDVVAMLRALEDLRGYTE